jgi:hypothetical protein
MQQRRLRLGDILDDYCPRERRVTNHAVVAMIEDQVKQTRCTTCDADHEYKQARVPARRKKETGTLVPKVNARTPKPRTAPPLPVESLDAAHDDDVNVDEFVDAPAVAEVAEPIAIEPVENVHADDPAEQETAQEGVAAASNEDGPVHRRLIRATLPRPEGQPPQDWKNPDFTVRQPGGGRGGGFEGNRNGHRPSGRGRRTARAQGTTPGQPSRFTGQRQGGPRQGGSGQPHGPGNRSGGGRQGPTSGHGQGHGQHRGQRPGGHGRKRGR